MRCAATLSGLLAALVSAAAPAGHAAAQETSALDEQFEIWLGGFISGPIGGTAIPELFTFSDVHFRTWDDFSPHWVLLRPGIGVRLTDGMFAVLGYAWTPSWRARDSVGFTDEHRIWEQWHWEIQDAPTRVRFQIRTRFEQRFRTQIALDVAVRYRQMLRLSVGLNAENTVLLVLWDEIFFGLNDAGGAAGALPYARAGFDQNRLFVGWAFAAVPGQLRFELGYFNQWIHRTGNPLGDAVNHTAMLNTYVSWR